MRIAVISDTIYPTPFKHGHGLGRAAYNVAQGLHDKGHVVILFGSHGSYLRGGKVITVDPGRGEESLLAAILRHESFFDVAVDLSHEHFYAQRQYNKPTLAYFQDRASAKAPNAVFVSFDQMNFIGLPGMVVRNGVDFDKFPLYIGERENYLLFIGSDIAHKGIEDARKIAKIVGMPLLEFGAGLRGGYISGNAKVDAIQNAAAMLCPYKIDAGPHVPLEAQSCGTPVIALNRAALPEYVFGGYFGDSVEEMAGYVSLAMELDPVEVRRRIVAANFSVERQVRQIENLLEKVLDGETW